MPPKIQTIVSVVICLTLSVLTTVLVLFLTMPDLSKNVITDEICLPDNSGDLTCGKTEKRLFQYTKTHIDAELQQLNGKYQQYVATVNDKDNENYITLKDIVENMYFTRKPAARLVMRDDLVKDKRDPGSVISNFTMVQIKKWESGRDLRDFGGYLRFGMLNNDGRIMVPVTGTYAVCSFVLISSRPGSSGKSFRHALYKYNLKDNREVELITNLKPMQNHSEKGNSNQQVSFLYTIVKLISEEEVLVKVSDNAYLPQDQRNYLAVYLT